jgi:hypothetical protein
VKLSIDFAIAAAVSIALGGSVGGTQQAFAITIVVGADENKGFQ